MPIPASISGVPMMGFAGPTIFQVGFYPAFMYQINGLGWSMEEVPMFNTLDQRTAAGREVMNALYLNPLHSWKLKYNFLEMDANKSFNNPITDFQILYSFYSALTGRFGEFLYRPREYSVTAQVLSTPSPNPGGYVEMVYSLGPFFSESVQELNGGTPTIFDGASDVTSTCTFFAPDSISPYSGIVFTSTHTFSNIPTSNFNFFYRSHFDEDKYTFEEFMYHINKTGIGFSQVRI